MGRWGLTDPELLKVLDEDPELVRMVEHLAAENGETPNLLLSRLVHREFEKELDTAFETQPGSRYRRILKAGATIIDQIAMKMMPALAAIPASLQAVTTTASPMQLSVQCNVVVANGAANFSSLIAIPTA